VDNAASGSARDSPDAASASASVPPSGTDSPGCPSPFPSRGDNALFGAPDSHPSSSRRFASAHDDLQQSRGLIPEFLSLVVTPRRRQFNNTTASNIGWIG